MAQIQGMKAWCAELARGFALLVALLAARGEHCLAQSSSTSATAASAPPRREATIGIMPQASRVCPGQSFEAKYVERRADGSQTELPPRDVRQVARSDDEAATMRRDGSWQTSTDPMRSVLTGFHLSVGLASDSSVRGDTVVAPSYECSRLSVKLPPADQAHPAAAYVRLGVFATPFYDSVVVAVVELETRVMGVGVFLPSAQSGVIQVSAPGKNGVSGRGGRDGSNGVDCSNGDDGFDGDPGEPGHPGGEVDLITQQGSLWLAELVAVSNPGGRGGDGGSGGRGGAVGTSGRTAAGGRSATCNARVGRMGKAGRPGPDGPAGRSRVTSVLAPLLWPGSPIWSVAPARRAIEGLMAYDQKRGG